jgi:hypothetical protein
MRLKTVRESCVYLLVAATAALSSGCAILESVPLDAANPSECRAAAGIYFLPKKEIKVAVSQATTAPGAFILDLSDNGSVPDRGFPYCLDFLGSAAADDLVVVERTNGLLTHVHANASDKSLEIAESLVNTAIVGVTGNPSAALRAARLKFGDTYEVADFIFDPFDRQRLAQINESLGLFGYCIFIDGHTLGPFNDEAIQEYCNKPTVYQQQFYKAPLLAARDDVIRPNFGGIAYRASATRAFYVMRKRDPGSGSRWLLHASQMLEMPNESPIFSIAVDRSAFVTRDTNLIFNNGVLTNVTISKPSEALAAAGFTLRLAGALIDVPAQIVRVRVQAVNNRKAIIDAQNQLIYTQQQYANTVESLRAGSVGNTVARASIVRGATIDSDLVAPTSGATPERAAKIDQTCSSFNPVECNRVAKTTCASDPDVVACISRNMSP